VNWCGLNNALLSWRKGVNALLPTRSTRSDGGRADSSHASTSEHQPDSDGTVDAFDEDANYLGSTNQAGNADEREIRAALDRDFMADPRAHLIIANRTVRNDEIGNWKTRAYSGDSPHIEHTHRQVHQSREDDGRPWKFTHTTALLRRMNGDDDVTPEDLLDYDSVPNLYGDAATNKTVTVRSALKAAVSADVKIRDAAAAISELRSDVAALAVKIDALVAAGGDPAAR
jgi:hypothetical protein